MPNFNSIGSGVSEPQVAENRYLPLTGGIALTTVYALTCYTVMYSIQTQPVDLGTSTGTFSLVVINVILTVSVSGNTT